MKNNTRILIIDDDKNIWKSYQSILNKTQAKSSDVNRLEDLLLQGSTEPKKASTQNNSSYDLSFAQQGEEGFLTLKTAHAQGKPFSLAFVDIRMPPGWDGVKTARAIRDIDSEIEIVIVTAYADISRHEMIEQIGQPEKLLFLRKPFDTEELSQIALQLTEKWRLSAEQQLQQQKIENLVDELQHTHNYLDSIINSITSCLICVSQELLITHWNQASVKNTGISHEQAMGSKVTDQFKTIFSLGDLIRSTIDKNISTHLDKVVLNFSGENRLCEINIYPLKSSSSSQNSSQYNEQNSRGAVIRIDDITERDKLEEIMVQSDKMLTVGGLAAGMAHEINTPLGSIIQSAQVITNRLDKHNEKNQQVAHDCGLDIEKLDLYMHERRIFQLLDGIRDGGSRTSKIIKSMLSFSHQGTTLNSYQINEVIDEALELAKSDYDLKKRYHFLNFNIIRDYANEIPNVNFDSTQLQQVILNLIKNSAQAMLEKYEVQEKQGMLSEHKPMIKITTMLEAGKMIIKVKDNGPGISNVIIKRIFDPFFTTKEVGIGTGLGLSLAYFIINRQHNGTIQATSELGGGAEFMITLPVILSEPDSQQK